MSNLRDADLRLQERFCLRSVRIMVPAFSRDQVRGRKWLNYLRDAKLRTAHKSGFLTDAL